MNISPASFILKLEQLPEQKFRTYTRFEKKTERNS